MKYILVHGLGQTGADWQRVQDSLHRETECPDLYELLGESAEYHELFQKFVEWCNAFDEPLHLCGLSLGGVLALEFAAKFPERVISLVLAGTPYKIPKLLFGIQNLVFQIMPRRVFHSMGTSKENVITLTKSMKHLEIPLLTQEIVCKTLVLCGERDRANHKSDIQLNKAIANSRFIEIKRAAHEINMDSPQEFARVLDDFWKV